MLKINTITIAARDPRRIAEFWVEALDDWRIVDVDSDGDVLIFPAESAADSPATPPIMFYGVDDLEGRAVRWHFDLVPGDQEAEVARLESLGATRIDIGQGDVDWVVMADPEGNRFCVLRSFTG